jgi:hypothetical protein
MFGLFMQVVIFVGVAVFMWSVSSSLEQIAGDLKRLADHTGAKESVEDMDRLLDA